MIVPAIFEPVSFEQAVERSKMHTKNIFFDLNAAVLQPSSFKLQSQNSVGLFIGPEGGWDQEEIALVARVSHIDMMSLGSLTLRAETAAVVATYLVTTFLTASK